jgi:hypothetical protein
MNEERIYNLVCEAIIVVGLIVVVWYLIFK